MSLTDPAYLDEIERERSLNMTVCQCSNCDPQSAARLILLLPTTNVFELNDLMSSRPSGAEDLSLLNLPNHITKRKMTSIIPLVCKANDPIRVHVPMIDLAVSIIGHFEQLFHEIYPIDPQMKPETLFDREDAWQLVKNYGSVANGCFLRDILGGETLPGMFIMIIECIRTWLRSESYKQHENELEDLRIANDQEVLDTMLVEEEHQEELRLKALPKKIKAEEIAKRKVLRIQKAEEAARSKEKKIFEKQRKVAESLGLLQ